ncbi:MAG: DUF3078 domain-containing protein [Bacteroidota bacterium]|nr:DUF3078 domain-containing protein [Bacteroidota bacterium]
MRDYKNSLCVLILIFSSVTLSANEKQDTLQKAIPGTIKYWKVNGNTALHFNQISLINWSSGGESSLAGKGSAKFDIDYQNDKFTVDNNMDLVFGLVGQKGSRVQKTDDKINFSSTFSYKAFENWSYSTYINLKTQFANGYKYPDDSTLISTFFAPAFLTTSLGMKYKPSDEFLLILSPASGKFTFVMDQGLANKGSFGVRPAVFVDSTGEVISKGKNHKAEFGMNVVLKLNKEIFKNIRAESKLNLYNNYLDEDVANRWNIDLDWESNISFVINDHVSTDLFLHMVYDHDTKIPVYEIRGGEKIKVNERPKLQFKESLGIGLSFKF